MRKSLKPLVRSNETDPISTAEVTTKLFKSDQPTSAGRSIKERNRILLEILDQRSCEIRNLKLRISNMVRTNTSNVFSAIPNVPPPNVKERQTVVKTEPNTNPTTPDWSLNELSQAYSLQKLNPILYAQVQQRYALPLPLPTEIDEFVNKVRIENGHMLGSVLKMLQCDGEHMSELERVSVLQISQLPLRPSFAYVEKSDSILHSSSDTMFVILARGLVGNWQHPIYVNSNADDLINVVKAAIVKLNDIQFNVIACCSRFEDDVPSKIWTDLGAGRAYCYFSHPVTNDPIYTFYYVEDILRSVHLHLMTKNGFNTDMGATINRKPIDALLLDTPGTSKFRAELNAPSTFFTTKTIDLLRIVRPDSFAPCSDFVEVFTDYQQMVRTQNYGGDNLEQQLQVLSHVQLQLHTLKCYGTNVIPEFKHATTHSIESLKLLQHSMRQKYGVDLFPGRSISEDYLRTLVIEPQPIEQALHTLRRISFPRQTPPTVANASIDLAAPERNHVQQIIDGLARNYALTDRAKFVQDLWRIEEKFKTLWTPFFAGNVHVLRDTLGKVKPSASLEGAVEFVRKRIELRVDLVNALGGVSDWSEYQSAKHDA